jgi:hypothetical protein
MEEEEEEEAEAAPVVQYSLERRKKYVGVLLRKYELDNLVRCEEREGGRRSSRPREGRCGRKR